MAGALSYAAEQLRVCAIRARRAIPLPNSGEDGLCGMCDHVR